MRRPHKHRRLIAAAATITALVGLTTQIASAAPTTAARAAHPASPIKHVVEIMLENHSFDNLFAWTPSPTATLAQNGGEHPQQREVGCIHVEDTNSRDHDLGSGQHLTVFRARPHPHCYPAELTPHMRVILGTQG